MKREGERLREEIRPGMKRVGEGKKGGDFSGFGDLELSRALSGGGTGTEERVKAVYPSPPPKSHPGPLAWEAYFTGILSAPPRFPPLPSTEPRACTRP